MNAVFSKSPDHEKRKKYDRQLRLWGDHGQTCLESSQICLINATATGTEILKSIVLPGVGGFTIVDGQKITGEDVGNNFFLSKDRIGESRAQVATQLLLELNTDVQGDFVDETPEHIFDHNPSFFNNFSVVIATNMHESTLLNLSKQLWQHNVPLLVCQTYGMLGYMRIQVKEHTIIESHPDNAHDDLRLDHPFPKLVDYVNSINMSTMEKKEHSHTPYLVIILKYLLSWKTEHNGDGPKNYKEKDLFRQMIKSGILVNENGIPEDEENFAEALKAVNTALIQSKIPENVNEIFNDPSCENLKCDTNTFWILAKSLKDFVHNEGNGLLPLRGTLPDMFSDSKSYILLQNLYRAEAANHAQAISKYVDDNLHAVGIPPGSIPESDIRLFCKNAHFLRVLKGQSLQEEYDPSTMKLQEIVKNLDDPDSEMVYYILLRAVSRFFNDYNRYPGYYEDQIEPDIVKLKNIVNKLLQEWNCGYHAKDDYIHEICKYGGSEVPSVAAFIGGCAAHEVIKLLTSQYVPFNNTMIYNAMNVTCSVFNL